jgi:quaternary ammonium compound-resistance protein SugE
LPHRSGNVLHRKNTQEDDLPHFGNAFRDGPALSRRAFMAWFLLMLAGILEIVWAYSMKLSNGFTKLLPSAVTLAAMLASVVLLALAMRVLPLGTAYTVWTGIGAVGAFVIGVIALGEPLTPLRVLAAILIVSGIVLMKLASGE